MYKVCYSLRCKIDKQANHRTISFSYLTSFHVGVIPSSGDAYLRVPFRSPAHVTCMAIARYKSYHRGGLEAPAFVMQEYAKTFYKSKAWQSCRASYLKQARGLCEQCLKRGLYTPADTVHHITHITPQNINDPSVTLNFSNLLAVCRDCHAELHKGRKRYKIDKFGRVTAV